MELAVVEDLLEDDFLVGDVDFLLFPLLFWFFERIPLIEVKSVDVSVTEGGT